MHEIEQRISQILVRHFGIAEEKITPAASFREDMAADSLDLLDLTLAIEEEFGIEVDDRVAEEIHTVGELLDFVRSQPVGLQAA